MVVSERQQALIFFPFVFINISYLLYIFELALLSAFIYLLQLSYLCAEVIPLAYLCEKDS